MVSTVIQLNNPNDNGTCHNLDSNLIEVKLTVYIYIYIYIYTHQNHFKFTCTATAREYNWT